MFGLENHTDGVDKKSRKGKGRTMIEKRVIPFSPPDISELEMNEVAEAMKSGWITTGPRTKELEKRLAEYCHTNKVVCLNSATAAEELNFRVHTDKRCHCGRHIPKRCEIHAVGVKNGFDVGADADL